MTSTREETAGCRLPSYALSFSPILSTSPHSCSPQALPPPPPLLLPAPPLLSPAPSHLLHHVLPARLGHTHTQGRKMYLNYKLHLSCGHKALASPQSCKLRPNCYTSQGSRADGNMSHLKGWGEGDREDYLVGYRR